MSGIKGRIAVASFGAAIALVLAGLAVVPNASADDDRFESYRGYGRRTSYYKQRAERYERAYNELAKTLERVESVSGRHGGDHRLHRQLERTIEAGRRRAANELNRPYEDDSTDYSREHEHVRDYGDDVYQMPGTSNGTGQLMSQRDFAVLVESVRSAGYSSNQLDLVRAAAAYNYFTIDQVVALISAASYADTQVEIAAMLYPRCSERDLWGRVYQSLQHQSSRDQLRQRLGQ